ncbi:MAG: SDR family oxidoreductase [Phycisphaeraceae bacterium]
MDASADNGRAGAGVALVTGGARRVGRAVALALAGAGMDVAITYRQSAGDARRLVDTIEAMGRQALAIEADLAEPDAPEHVARAVEDRFGSLKALVNNAAIFAPTPITALDAATYDRFQAVNARAPAMLTQRLAGLLAAGFREDEPASTGRVVNFVDIHVMGEPTPGYAAYNASKAALLELTRSLAVELGPAVTVNGVAPGVVAWAPGMSEGYRQAYLERTPLGRAGTPADAAEAVRWLVCDAHYCTGQVIRVDGGRLLG